MKRKPREFKKPRTFLIVVALGLVVSLVVACGGKPGAGGQPGGGDWTLDSINELQEFPDEDTIDTLIALVEDDELDPYLRERALSVLTDVSIRLDRMELDRMEMVRNSQTREYLKGIALDQTMPASLQSAALANIDLIDTLFPPERHGTMTVDVRGEIKPGNRIAILVSLLSDIYVGNARVCAGMIYHHTETEDPLDVPIPIITPITDPPLWEGELKEDTVQELRFDFQIEAEGEMDLPVSYKLSFDEMDYEFETQSLVFTVTTTGGEFSRAEDRETEGISG